MGKISGHRAITKKLLKNELKPLCSTQLTKEAVIGISEHKFKQEYPNKVKRMGKIIQEYMSFMQDYISGLIFRESLAKKANLERLENITKSHRVSTGGRVGKHNAKHGRN